MSRMEVRCLNQLLVASSGILETRSRLCLEAKEMEARLDSFLKKVDDQDRKFAEVLFLQALLYAKTEAYNGLSGFYALACLELLLRLPSETIEDCATSTVSIEGVLLPDFLDYAIAKKRFEEAGINLNV